MLKSFFGLFGKSGDSTAVLDRPEVASQTSAKGSSSTQTATSSVSDVSSPESTPAVDETTLTDKYRSGVFADQALIFYRDSVSPENASLVIRAAYRQVFGNAHIMDTEKDSKLESQLRLGQISVADFIRSLAKSDHYKNLFWDKYPNATFIELNFKHLLGRAPNSYAEIKEHGKILSEGGFDAEIDSYLDSDEYYQTFGDNIVPYTRAYNTEIGKNAVSFTHAFPLMGVACSSDKSFISSKSPRVQANLITSSASKTPPLRPIPDSYPEELIKGKGTGYMPNEIRAMGRELWQEIQNRKYYYNL